MEALISMEVRRRDDWELTIVDVVRNKDLNCLSVADIDGDGRLEVVTGGQGGMHWYRTATGEGGRISDLDCHCACPVEDVDGDGLPEIVVGDFQQTAIHCLKAINGLRTPWQRFDVDPDFPGGAHDLLFRDIDGDGERELVAVAMYSATPAVYIYALPSKLGKPWRRYAVQEGTAGDGTDAADVDGDGIAEIVQGPYLWKAPLQGPYAGPWRMTHVAAGFREMCRARFCDITGNGRPDLVICEAEYPNGRLSWFENRTLEDPENPWIEHPIDRHINYGHSLDAIRTAEGIKIFAAEMARGGWEPKYNWDAREMFYISGDDGKTWTNEIVCEGTGTHEAKFLDLDGDGDLEIVGKECYEPRLQVWKKASEPSPFTRFRHSFIDRQKKGKSIDIIPFDVDGDGREDVVTGRCWYQAPHWKRYTIPGVEQVVNVHDIDGDGTGELIAVSAHPDQSLRDYERLSSNLCWVKALDPERNRWERHSIGSGSGDWPHGTVMAPLLKDGGVALVACYHSGHFPEIFEVPEDPASTPWPKRILARIPYREQVLAWDLTGNGLLDLVCGYWWLENMGDGSFDPHRIAEVDFEVARVAVTDVDGDGSPDIVVAAEDVDWEKRIAGFAPVAWFRNPGDPRKGPWHMTMIDTLRSPHSLAVHDLDGDGEDEVIVGEHDPFKINRSRSRLVVYRKADPAGGTWKRFIIEDRFEHHDGAKLIDLGEGRKGIISTGWVDDKFVSLWEMI